MDNIRPIKTEADYQWAMKEITAYFEHQPEPGSPEGDRFDVLATLIEAYEDAHYPITVPDPVDMIASFMQLKGLTQNDLAELLGSSPRASEILRRKRAITLDMAYKLNRRWGIPADVLIQPYRLAAT